MHDVGEVLNKQNPAGFDEIVAANVVWHDPVTGDITGIEGFKQLFAMTFTAFPDFHVTIEDIIAEGDKVAARWTATGTHKGEFMGIPPTGVQITMPGMVIHRFADGKIVESWHLGDNLGMLQQLGVIPSMEPKDYSNVFFMPISPGLNMISLPLEPTTPYTARFLAEYISATVVIKYDETLGRFVGFTSDAPDDGFAIEGGKGYIVNVPNGGMVAFVGAAWTRPPIPAAPPTQSDSAWAFVVSGSVLEGDGMSAADDSYTAIVRNLRTGDTFTEPVDSSGYFAAAWADLTRKAVIGAGDQVEVAVVHSSGEIVSGPFIHDIKPDEIRNAVANLHLKLGDIIPARSALLQNYPNPFNPETWIPFHLKSEASVSIRIYSISGQLIRVLDLGHKDAGIYVSRSKAAYWDGKNEAGEDVASGIYFYSITAGDFYATRKMTVRK